MLFVVLSWSQLYSPKMFFDTGQEKVRPSCQDSHEKNSEVSDYKVSLEVEMALAKHVRSWCMESFLNSVIQYVIESNSI